MAKKIILPTGEALKYKLPQDKGRPFRTNFYPEQLEKLGKRKKSQLPILMSSNTSLVFVDFDPKDYPAGWTKERLQNAIEFNLPYALTVQSPSGNPKAIILTDKPVQEKAEFLKGLLPESLHFFDRAGTDRCYATSELVSDLTDWLAAAPPAVGVEESRTIFNTVSNTRPYYQSSLDQLAPELRLWAKTDDRVQLLQILTACWGLLENFNLPLAKLADQLGVTPMTVSRFLKELKTLDVIECIDHTYKWGVKAKTYRAKGVLYKAIQAHKNSSKPSKLLPSTVIPGTFYKTCLSALNRFDTEDQFMNWVSRLGGINARRLREAKKFSRCHFKKKQARCA